jgi:nucleotide-binding universal stress UspA family protein
MTWKSIVAGVDDSPEGVRSAELAWTMAQRAGVACHLVHAAREYWTTSGGTDIPIDVGAMNRAVLEIARERLNDAFTPSMPEEALADLEVRLGRAAVLIREVVTERDAGLVVLGAKHHPAVTRWIGGSTVHNVVRTSRVPVMVTRMEQPQIQRVLVAVDVSAAAFQAVMEAKKLARIFNAEVRVMHAVEPLPLIAAIPVALDQDAYYRLSEEQFKDAVATPLRNEDISYVMRRGATEHEIAQEVAEWQADVLVVGSHGKGWVDRLLVGSTTERLLNHLPATTLVVPVATTQDSNK